MQIRHPSGVGELFHGGVHTEATTDAVVMENHVRRLAQAGLTHLYVVPSASVSAQAVVLMCRKYGCFVSNQVSNGYFQDNSVPSSTAAAAVGAEITTLKQYREYLSTSVRQSPLDQQSFIDSLFDYYAMIGGNVAGGAPLYLLQNNTGSAAKAAAKTFKPLMTGYSRTYLYIWNYDVANGAGNIGLLMHPRRALYQLDAYLGEFMPFVDTTAQWPIAMLLGSAVRTTTSQLTLAQRYDNGQLNGPNYTRWKNLSALGGGGHANQGLKVASDGTSLNSWSYYMPPPNCMSTQVWLAIARGYRGVFSWLCQASQGPDLNSFNLNGPAHKGSATLDELTKTVRELQKFGWLINHMQRSSTNHISYPPPPYLPITYSGSFTVPGYTGKVAAIVNADVGTWPNNEAELLPNSVFRIDDFGNAVSPDYTPKTQARTIAVTNTTGSGTMFDLETGTAIGDSTGNISLLPGKGKFIFIGNATELASLRAKCGIGPAITALSGLIPNREEVPANIQIVHGSDPKSDSSTYFFVTQYVPLNKRYRIVVTASSSNGSKLGVMTGYNQNGTIVSSHIRSAGDGAVLWNRALTSTPSTFTSEDFTISSGSLGYTWFYRSNQVGTIKIHDAWLEDCSTHRVIPITGWVDPTRSFPIDAGQTYHLYARVRNYGFDAPPARLGVEIQEFDAAGTLLGTHGTSPAISDAALIPQTRVFQAAFARQNPSAVTARVRFLNTAGSGTMTLESATVAQGTVTSAATEISCGDGVDNDSDGLVDCRDTVDCGAGQGCSVCGDGVVSGVEVCDTALTVHCSRACDSAESPSRCVESGDCPLGQVCPASPNGETIDRPYWESYCVPQGLCPQSCGDAITSPCGRCAPKPSCEAKRCGDDPSDGVGGVCRSFCAARESGCRGNEDCTAGLACGFGLGPQFDLPAGTNVCVPSTCLDFAQSRIPCGSLAAECGHCRPTPNACGGRQCGLDAHGNNCGACSAESYCSAAGQCDTRQALTPKHRPTVYKEPRTGITDPVATSPGTLPGTFAVSNSGTAQYVIPIDVPPGAAGIQPRLELAYDSSAGDGFIARGWNLRGFSIIHRCGTTGERGHGVEMTENDQLCLDDLPLVPVDPLLPPFQAQEYRTKPDTQRRIISYNAPTNRVPHVGPASFVVYNPDGKVHVYDTVLDATLGSVVRPGVHDVSVPVRYQWHLSSISAGGGSVLHIIYERFTSEYADGGIDKRKYTAELRPQVMVYGVGRSVKFSYSDDRPDLYPKSFTYGVPRHQSTSLSAIETFVEDVLVKKYVLVSRRDGRTKLLDSVQVCVPDGTTQRCLPKTTFDYSSQGASFAQPFQTYNELPQIGDVSETAPTSWLEREWTMLEPIVLDWNGDGRDDIIYRGEADEPPKGSDSVLMVSSGEISPQQLFATQIPLLDLLKLHTQPAHVLDINDDGRDDLLIVHYTNVRNSYDPKHAYLLVSTGGPAPFRRELVEENVNHVAVVDLDSDGRKDFVHCNGNGWSWRRNTGSGAFMAREVLPDVSMRCDDVTPMDMDGNGAEELVGGSGPSYLPYRPSGVIEMRNGNATVRTIRDLVDAPRKYLDANGDGRTDFVAFFSAGRLGGLDNGLFLYLNDGAGFSLGATLSIGNATLSDAHFQAGFTADHNGDHIEELYFPQWSGYTSQGFARHEPLARKVSGGEEWRISQSGINYEVLTTSGFRCGILNERTCRDRLYNYAIPALADFDGDGDRDLFMRVPWPSPERGPANPALMLYRSEASKRGLLTGAVDGLGKITLVEYEDGIRDPTYRASATCEHSAQCLKRVPHRMVRSFSVVGNGGPYLDPMLPAHRNIGITHSLEYQDARIDRAGRGWIGIAQKVDRVLALGSAVEIGSLTSAFSLGFHAAIDGYPFANTPVLETSTARGYSGPNSESMGVVNVVKRRITAPTLVVGSASYWVRPESIVDVTTENGVNVSVKSSQFSYDANANPKVLSENHLSGLRTTTIFAYNGSDLESMVEPERTAIREIYPELDDPAVSARHARALFALPLVTLTQASKDGRTNSRMSVSRYDTFGHATLTARFGLDRLTNTWARTESTVTGWDSFGNANYVEHSAPGQATRTRAVTYDPLGVFPTRVENGEHAAAGIPPTLLWHDPRFGQRTITVKPDGAVTFFGSDPFGRPRTAFGDGQPVQTWTYSGANEAGAMRMEVTGTGTVRSATDYNSFGQVVRTIAEDFPGHARSIEFGYNEQGTLVAESVIHKAAEPARGVRRYGYDTLNRLVLESHPTESFDGTVGESVARIEYGSVATAGAASAAWFQHNGGEYFAVASRNGQTKKVYVVGDTGDVRATIDEEGQVSTFEYDPFGPLARRQTGAEVWEGTFDSWGRLVESRDPDRGTEQFRWNGFGELEQLRRPGMSISFGYDTLGRPKTRVGPGAGEQWFWDGNGSEPAQAGHLAFTIGSGIATTYHYDAPGAQLSSKTTTLNEGVFTSEFRYDAQGNLQTSTFPDGGQGATTVRYERNAFGRVTSISDVTGGASRPLWATSGVDGFGNDETVVHGNGLRTQRVARQATGDLGRVTVSAGSSVHFGEAYDYDQEGRLSGRSPTGAVWETFAYDSRDRLETVRVGGSLTHQYAYDANGNMRTGPEGTTLVYSGTRPHAVSSTSAEDFYEYDDRGNQTLRTGPSTAGGHQRIEYSWFDLPRVVYQGIAEDTVTTYDYDINLQRVREVNPTTQITAIGGPFRLEIDRASGVRTQHVSISTPDGGRVELSGLASSPSIRYHHLDRLGSTRLVTDAQGSGQGAGSYQPFGAPAVTWDGDAPAATSFTGHEYNHSLGLIDMKGRFYDPAIGRFLSPDPIVQDAHSPQAWNRYSYVWNSPTNYVDPTGFQLAPPSPPPAPAVSYEFANHHVYGSYTPPAPTTLGPVQTATPPVNSPSAISNDAPADTVQGPRGGAPVVPNIASPTATISEVQSAGPSLPPITTMAQAAQVLNANKGGVNVSLLYEAGGGFDAAMSAAPLVGIGYSYQTLMDEFAPPWSRMLATVAIAAEVVGAGNVLLQAGKNTERLLAAGAIEEVAARGGVLEGANFAQKTFGAMFSKGGAFAGRSVADVAAALRSGAMKASEVPIDYIVRGGNTLILNTRSAQALEAAGIPRAAWNAVNRTGQELFESMLTGQLQRNGLTSAGTAVVRQSGL